jgi:hypothetical protein
MRTSRWLRRLTWFRSRPGKHLTRAWELSSTTYQLYSSWPDVTVENLKFLTCLAIWAGVIEDYMEKLTVNEKASENFHSNARTAFAAMLDLDFARGKEFDIHPLVAAFEPFAKKLLVVCDYGKLVLCPSVEKAYLPTVDQRVAFFNELDIYIRATEIEARLRHEGRMPSHSEYIDLRYGSIGFGFFLRLSE